MENIFQEGILLVDKPSGITSHTVVNWARKCADIKKIGHTGTLDPLASGLLILLIGKTFTRMQEQFLKQEKTYVCTAELGVTTDSYDSDGKVMSTVGWDQVRGITRAEIETVLREFLGETQQMVPVFSAVKQRGKKLYQLARQGKTESVILPKRTVVITKLVLLAFTLDKTQKKVFFTYEVHCSSGTYIRSLTHDIGQKLGVGAMVTALRRTLIGTFSLDDAVVCPVPRRFRGF